MSQPKRYTLKADCDGEIVNCIEDPNGQWIFDPDHRIPLLDTRFRLACGSLDEVCVDCEENCPAAGGLIKNKTKSASFKKV